MKRKRGFAKNILAAIHESKILGIRAGTSPHRIIGIWAVVVEGRVFVRSWSLAATGWYRTLLEEPIGVIEIAGREIPIRSVHIRSERLKGLVSEAYAEKYNTPGSRDFVRGLAHKRRRDTTTELLPL